MYDFANSGFTTVVITAVFNTYFVAVVAGNAVWATLAWSAALSVSYALILVTAPVLGAYADARGAKKTLLAAATLGCVAGTAGLALAGPHDLVLAMALLVLANFCFGSGENLIAAFLPELARGRSLGRLSGWGWGLGYLGGIATLGTCLAYITWAQGRGHTAEQYVPVVLLITAGIFALAALPTYLLLRERAVPTAVRAGRGIVGLSLERLGATLGHAARYPDMGRFLVCVVFYQAGIQAVITLAAIYAQQALGFATRDTLVLILAVNFCAAAGALALGHLQDRWGHVRTIAFTLLGWILVILLAWSATAPGRFWLAASLAGLCMGSTQAAGRALIGYFSPPGRRAEFFGLWGLAVKLASILGPLTYGVVNWASGGDHRLAILITGLYFVVGLLVLGGIDTRRGRRAALARASA
ncbi:MAG: MFS transporter [Thiobacillus sp.]|nr:MFS transporter [Thiobacillus sp.]